MTFDEVEELFEQDKIWSRNMMKDAIKVLKERGFYDINELLSDEMFMEGE